MPSPSARAEHTRQAILQAAHDLFLEQGYHGTSMRQIARRAQVALGGIYNHFAGKEAVFAAVLDAYHPYRQVLPLLEQATADSFPNLVRSATHHLLDVLRQRPDFLNLAMIEIVEFQGRHTDAMMERLMLRLEALIHRFVCSEDMRPIPPPLLLRLFVGLVFGYFLFDRIGPSEASLSPDEIADVFLYGVLQP